MRSISLSVSDHRGGGECPLVDDWDDAAEELEEVVSLERGQFERERNILTYVFAVVGDVEGRRGRGVEVRFCIDRRCEPGNQCLRQINEKRTVGRYFDSEQQLLLARLSSREIFADHYLDGGQLEFVLFSIRFIVPSFQTWYCSERTTNDCYRRTLMARMAQPRTFWTGTGEP